MNNNQLNFDPILGQPVNNNGTINQQTFEATSMQPVNNNSVINQQSFDTTSIQLNNNTSIQQQPDIEHQTSIQTLNNNTEIANNVNIQQQMQNIPTIEQTKQDFINNTQATTIPQTQEKKDGPNILFIIILFTIIFAALFFVFPMLIKIL